MPASPLEFAALAMLMFASAVVYSSGGHAGASAYLAAMALFGVMPATMKPTALALNIVVAIVGSIRFARMGLVPWQTLRWLCAGSVPAAYLGGSYQLSSDLYRLFLGLLLLVGATRLWVPPDSARAQQPFPSPWVLVTIGAVLGLVSGLTGIGGGIFLSPILILTGWESPRRTGGAAAVFILVNSTLGFLGHLSAASLIPESVGILAVVVFAGGLMGSWIGVHRLNPLHLRRVHALVLTVSGAKLFLEGWR